MKYFLTAGVRICTVCGMNAKFTMLFNTKTEREQFKRIARQEGKSLAELIRELLCRHKGGVTLPVKFSTDAVLRSDFEREAKP